LKVWVFIRSSRKEDKMTHLNPHCPICDEGWNREALHAACWRCINSEGCQQISDASKRQAEANEQIVSDRESVSFEPSRSVINAVASWFDDVVTFARLWLSWSAREARKL
jgi:hypothetical protein